MENRYLIPSLVLFLALLAIGAFSLNSHRSLMGDRSNLATQEAELNSVATRVEAQRALLDEMKASATPSNTFMAQWRSALGANRDGNAMLTDLSRFGNDATVSVQGRKSGASEYLWRGKPLRVQFAEGTGVSGEYYRLVNWMGEMERAWPLARFEQIAFEQKGPSLQLLLKLSYPSFLTEAAAK